MKPALLASCALLAGALHAQQTLIVPDGYATIQAAIDAAETGDTVVVRPGTYVEQIDMLGKAIVLRSEGGPDVTTIDSQGASRWFDEAEYCVVRMISGEGPSTVLEGFTITGGNAPSPVQDGSGVYARNLSPTLRDCTITGNVGRDGGGVQGNVTIEGCRITNNRAAHGYRGGGVYGQVVVRDSVITGNISEERGGGIYSTGDSLVEDTILDGNSSGRGPDGYTGGGYFGPGTLRRCQITRNDSQHRFFSGGVDELGTGVDGATAMIQCTVAFNTVLNGAVPGDESGGIRNVGLVEGCILFGNENLDVALLSSPTVRYSIVGSGFAGTGNTSADPQFRDAASGDYFLQPWSPAIDAGDPLGFPDPDGTEPDLGAFFFPQFQASRVLRNGSGVNLASYGSILDPVVGTAWVATVDAASHGIGATMVSLIGFADPLTPLAFPFGELLVDVNSANAFVSTELVLGGQSVHQLPIPPDYSLGGLELFTQGVVFGSGIALTNALDLTVGL